MLQINQVAQKNDLLLNNSVSNADNKVKFAMQALNDFKNELMDGQELKFAIEKEKMLEIVEKFVQQR